MSLYSHMHEGVGLEVQEDSRNFFYPQTRDYVERKYKKNSDMSNTDDHRLSANRLGRKRQEFIPFINERDKIGRLIVRKDQSASPNVSQNDSIEIKKAATYAIQPTYSKLTMAKSSSQKDIRSKVNYSDYYGTPGTYEPESANMTSPLRNDSSYVRIMKSNTNDSSMDTEARFNSSNLGYQKFKYVAPINTITNNTPRIYALHDIVPQRTETSRSSCFKSLPRDRAVNPFYTPKPINNPSIGHYKSNDSVVHPKTRDISFGRVPKFFEIQGGKVNHSLEVDSDSSFKHLYNRIKLVPNFMKQGERKTEFSEALSNKSRIERSPDVVRFEKEYLKNEKYKLSRNELVIKELQEVEKKRKMDYYLNQKNSPLDHPIMEERLWTIKSKYKVKNNARFR